MASRPGASDPTGLCRRSATGSAPAPIQAFFERLAQRAAAAAHSGRSGCRVLVGTVAAAVGTTRTLVFDAPRRARAFVEALVADNLDLGRPDNVELIFIGPRR